MHVVQVTEHNAACMRQLFSPAEVYDVPMGVSPPITEEHIKRDAYLETWLQRRFHELPSVAVGARVMLTQNVALAKGQSNGAQGTVVQVHVRDGQVRGQCLCQLHRQ
jgi:hypothetical protein